MRIRFILPLLLVMAARGEITFSSLLQEMTREKSSFYYIITHWYGAPGSAHNRPPLPAAAALPVPQVEDVIAFTKAALADVGKESRLKDAIEMEKLKDPDGTK